MSYLTEAEATKKITRINTPFTSFFLTIYHAASKTSPFHSEFPQLVKLYQKLLNTLDNQEYFEEYTDPFDLILSILKKIDREIESKDENKRGPVILEKQYPPSLESTTAEMVQ